MRKVLAEKNTLRKIWTIMNLYSESQSRLLITSSLMVEIEYLLIISSSIPSAKLLISIRRVLGSNNFEIDTNCKYFRTP